MNVLKRLTGSAYRGVFLLPQGCRHFGQPAAMTHPHLLKEDEVTPGITKEEYKARRYAFMKHIAQNDISGVNEHMVIIPSNTTLYMAHDVPYPFRQNTDFWYLCGFLEPDSVLIMHRKEGSSTEHKSVLFVPKRDPKRELWDGLRSGIDGAIQLTGVDAAHNAEDLERYLNLYLKQVNTFALWYHLHKPAHVEYHFKYIHPFISENRHCSLESPVRVLHQLRLQKSPAEISLMRKSCQIAGKAFTKVMQFSQPGIEENHLHAKMDFECNVNGAERLAYPPVVAGGDRANIIHYVRNDQRVQAEQLVLMDAGCQYHGYSSDITRTWPVSGYFTEEQQLLYEAVLRVQEACVEMCSGNVSLDMLYDKMLQLIGRELKRLGIVSRSVIGPNLLQMAREVCPHHVGHYLGMDVHDSDLMPRGLPVKPGMVITIEPGIYIPESRTDFPEKFRGIGIRIEDDILKTENGYENLSASCPKQLQDIENLMNI